MIHEQTPYLPILVNVDIVNLRGHPHFQIFGVRRLTWVKITILTDARRAHSILSMRSKPSRFSHPTRSLPFSDGKDARDDKDTMGEMEGALAGKVTLFDMRGNDARLALGSGVDVPVISVAVSL